MAQGDAATSTLAPTLRLVVDLGEKPSLPYVRKYFDALDDLCGFARDIAAWQAHQVRHDVRLSSLDLRVDGIRLASPLEVVLTAASGKAAPVAYAVTAMFLLERAVKLLMEWQRHRKEIQEPIPLDHTVAQWVGTGVIATAIVADLTSAESGRALPTEFDSRSAHRAVETLALVPIRYVEMTGTPGPERPNDE